MQNIKMTINTLNKNYAEEKTEKFNKIAKRLGKEAIITIWDNERIEEAKNTETNEIEIIELIDLDITVKEELKIEGYKIIAMLDHTYPNRNFIKTYETLEENYIKELELKNSYCEHCNSNRKRNVTYIVEDTEGKRIQVGKTCLNDYIGHDILKSLNYFDLLQELQSDITSYNLKSSRKETFLKVVDILEMVENEIKSHGYTSNKTEYEGNGDSTGTKVKGVINSIYSNIDSSKRYLKKATKDYKEEIKTLMEYETEKDYYNSLKDVLRHEYCKFNKVKLLATFFVALDIIKKEQHQEEQKEKSNFVSTPGAKIETEITLEKVINFETQYGYKHINLYRDAEGNILKWVSKNMLDMEVGENKTIKATVKEHEEYNGEKQTSILRVKII